MGKKRTEICFGKTDDMIYQIIVQSAIPLSTNDVYQRMLSQGTFTNLAPQFARKDIAAKLAKLQPRGVISMVDEKRGCQLWQLEPKARASLPKVTEIPPAFVHRNTVTKKTSKTVAAGEDGPPPAQSSLMIAIPAATAELWADCFNDLSYHAFREEVIDIFAQIERAIRNAIPNKEAA